MVLVLVGAPGGEHAAGELEALLAEGLLLGEPFGVAAEVALQMWTSTLGAGAGSRWLVAVPAVRDDDPRVGCRSAR